MSYATMSTGPFKNTMSSSQELIFPNELPPFSPVVYRPQIKYPYPFETDYSRDSARIRAVFDELVEKTKTMNLGKPEVPAAKRRARKLGLKVSIEQAKGLHWRSIQARHPVVLTAGPISPPRTPRRPATDYPPAEQLCLKNMADAQRRQNYAEACRWSYLADRERAISKWEAEQAIAFRARQALDLHTTVARHRDVGVNLLGRSRSERQKPVSSVGTPIWATQSARTITEPLRSSELQSRPAIEMPVNLMDRSQSITPEAANSSYTFLSRDQMQSFNLPHIAFGGDLTESNVRLARSTSIQRHIPATSLRMAPTPLRPKIDHDAMSFPTAQSTRLSFIHPTDTSVPLVPVHNSLNTLGYPVDSVLDDSSSSQTAVSVLSMDGPIVSDQTFADEYSLKKRRSEAEHVASQRTEQKKIR